MINEVKEMKRKNSEEEGVDEKKNSGRKTRMENNRENDWSGNGRRRKL